MENKLNLADSWKTALLNIPEGSDIREKENSLRLFEFACALNHLDSSCTLRYLSSLLCSDMWRWLRGEIAAMHWLEEKYGQPFMRTPFILTGDFMSWNGEVLVEVATQRSKSIVSKFDSFCKRSSSYGFKDKLLLRVDPDTLEVVDQTSR